jgi:hypothetical protein
VDVDSGVLPRRDVVLPLFGIPAREEAAVVLGVGEALVHDHRRVRVAADVLVEPALVCEDVVDDPAEERDVRPRANADVA